MSVASPLISAHRLSHIVYLTSYLRVDDCIPLAQLDSASEGRQARTELLRCRLPNPQIMS